MPHLPNHVLVEEFTVGEWQDHYVQYLVRLYADPKADERYWCDVEVYEVAGYDDGVRQLLLKDWQRSGDNTNDPDKAAILVDGFVKWDGCTQVSVKGFHVDSDRGYKLFTQMLLEARERAAHVMEGHWLT